MYRCDQKLQKCAMYRSCREFVVGCRRGVCSVHCFETVAYQCRRNHFLSFRRPTDSFELSNTRSIHTTAQAKTSRRFILFVQARTSVPRGTTCISFKDLRNKVTHVAQRLERQSRCRLDYDNPMRPFNFVLPSSESEPAQDSTAALPIQRLQAERAVPTAARTSVLATSSRGNSAGKICRSTDSGFRACTVGITAAVHIHTCTRHKTCHT